VGAANLDFIRDNGEKILRASSIDYLKTASFSGSLFGDHDDSGAVSSLFTRFFIDYKEPLWALLKFRSKGSWCLGELLDGHEHIVLYSVSPLSATSSRST